MPKDGRTEAKTVFFFSDSENALAVIAVSDKIKESSVEAIRQLHGMGIEVHMLTGIMNRPPQK